VIVEGDELRQQIGADDHLRDGAQPLADLHLERIAVQAFADSGADFDAEPPGESGIAEFTGSISRQITAC
jgi:hypothetical protein